MPQKSLQERQENSVKHLHVEGQHNKTLTISKSFHKTLL